MTYRVYIKKDYKPEISRRRSYHMRTLPRFVTSLAVMSITVVGSYYIFQRQSDSGAGIEKTTPVAAAVSYSDPQTETLQPVTPEQNVAVTETETYFYTVDEFQQKTSPLLAEQLSEDTISLDESTPDSQLTDQPIENSETENINWQSVTVKSGDSLALIFSRLGLSPNELYKIMSLGKPVKSLKRIKPGQIINFHIVDNRLHGLEFETSVTRSLSVSLVDDQYVAESVEHSLDTVVKNADAVINDSLFLSGKRAGLSDKLIMQLVSIYGWDIDFALDIREGDRFTVIYEEKYKDGEKVSDGPIIAAEFINQNNALRAVRYVHQDGSVDYYADNGDAMRKAFLRTPVNFTRISSRFNLKRKHPVLNRIRAHRGVDYAAPRGTPIKATGDGVVSHAGRKGGYGKTVILKHGGKYSTVYAHLNNYAKGVRSGKRVKQGQTIGYVGSTGLATGPHLHYEFRVHGVHQNPLTVKLPKAESISKKQLAEFKQSITPMLAELDRLTGKQVLAAKQTITTDIPNAVMEDG